jgi:hypothetical protein
MTRKKNEVVEEVVVEESAPEMLVESPDSQPSKGDALLRDANSGVFYRGAKPAGSPSGTNSGEVYWEVR